MHAKGSESAFAAEALAEIAQYRKNHRSLKSSFPPVPYDSKPKFMPIMHAFELPNFLVLLVAFVFCLRCFSPSPREKYCPILEGMQSYIQYGKSLYTRSPNAAINNAAKAPVVTCWDKPAAALCVEDAEALALVAEPEAEEDGELDVVAAAEVPAAVAARASAVALRVPHCSLVAQTDCASASLGLFWMHWM